MPQTGVSKDISPLLSDKVLSVIEKSVEYCKGQKQSVISEVDIFLQAFLSSEYSSNISDSDFEFGKKYSGELSHGYKKDFTDMIFLAPEAKIMIINAFMKKVGQLTEPEDILMAGISMPRIVNLIKANPGWGKCADLIFIKRKSKISSDLSGVLERPIDEDGYNRFFDVYYEQIIRGLSVKESTGLIILARRGVDAFASVMNALKTLRTNIPDFRFTSVYKMELSSLVGSNEKIDAVVQSSIEEIQANEPVILIIKGIEFFESDWKVALDLIETIRSQTEVKTIILTEDSFYKTFLENRPELQRLNKISIDEMDKSTILKVIDFKLKQLSESEKIGNEQGLGEKIYEMSKRYLPGIAFPEKAIGLISELAAQARISGKSAISEDILMDVIAQKTNLPLAKLTESEKDVLSNLEQVLSEKVIGQDEAIKLISQAIRRSRSGLKDPKKPIGSFLFLGPTGVGKTELAKTLGSKYFGDEKAFIRLDMSEFSEPNTVMRLIGSPPGYVGYDEGGQLTNAVLKKPYCLVLFDEIEKAHPKVFDIFLQILDEGRLTDSKGNLVDFKNTILIFTSNIGAEEIFAAVTKDPAIDKQILYQQTILPLIKNYFRIEMINRFDEIIIFNPLSLEPFKKIARLKLGNLEHVLTDKGIKLEIAENDMDTFVKNNADQKFGARSIERAIKEAIETPISEMIIRNQVASGQTINWSPAGIKIT